ncbi:MAG TPA: GspL/Epsl periplasmic domain-containing protein, partial [Rhodocyclaceae bacterium]|nr:GspL/Epsl periplasmic domain-containing protein [Rhodocyclaceae bacterium]
ALAAGAAALMLVTSLAEVLWQRHQLGNLEDRMRRLFETSVPNTPAIAPALQLRRTLAEVRARHGQLRDDDFLALLDAYAEIGGAGTRHSISRLEYADGIMQMRL